MTESIVINSLENYISQIRECITEWGDGAVAWFRGEPEVESPLLPKVFRETTIVISLLLFVFILILGASEYFTIRENLSWANQPRVCFDAPFRQEYYLQIFNHREGYLGALFDRDDSEAKVKSISEFAIVNDYLIGGSGLSSFSFFIFDLKTTEYRTGLSKDEIISELKMSGKSISFPLTPILDYCEIADCSPCDE